jgi:DNA-directed RNA polymerase subunit RPC12/RpoP
MKITRSTKSGCICGNCGAKLGTNEGGTETDIDGEVYLACPYCLKTTLMDVGVTRPFGGDAPWHRPEPAPPGYIRTNPIWKPWKGKKR